MEKRDVREGYYILNGSGRILNNIFPQKQEAQKYIKENFVGSYAEFCTVLDEDQVKDLVQCI